MSLPKEIASTKRTLREQMRTCLSALTPEDAARHSVATCAAIAGSSAFARAGTIMVYLPIRTGAHAELDPCPLAARALALGKRIAYPRIDWDANTMQPIEATQALPDSEVRRHNVPEPVGGAPIALGEIDMVIVPGLAFDARGHRLGRGAGFYDRFLAAWRASRGSTPGLAVGVGFIEQMVEKLPVESHDMRLDGVASPIGITICKARYP